MQRPGSETDIHEESKTEERTKTSAEDHLGAKILIRSQEDELLMDITDSLKEQVNAELDQKEESQVKCKKRKVLRVFLSTACLLIAAILILVLTPFGQGLLYKAVSVYAYGKMNHDDGILLAEEAETATAEVTVTPTVTLTPEPTKPEVKQITYNILLLGEEAIESGTAKGRTDIMMIATLDTEDKCIKLTSLMRDMLVDIPGYKENKLNTAYEYGGVPLLYDTIYQNFGVKLDGYMLVGFDAFEAIIDKLGGVTITLTDKEAEYLNTTNYISKEQYRNVSAGSQLLNGNQALGYCRVRYVATGEHELNDFGRTSRQRVVLNAIFDKYKTKSLPELALIANSLLSYITTDFTQEEFTSYLQLLTETKKGELQTLRIPADNTFEEGKVRGMSVLIPDKYENRKLLQSFIKQEVKE